jgi:hypothetical protein
LTNGRESVSALEKAGLVALVAIFAACGIIYVGALVKNRELTVEVSGLRARLAECGKQQGIIAATIEKQNAAIEAARVDTVYVDREKQKIITRYSTIRDTVVKSIERDSSCENRLENIAGVMRRFYGVE